MYSGSTDQSIMKWDIESFGVVTTISGHENPVCTLTVDKNRKRLYSGSLKSIKVCILYTTYRGSSILTTCTWFTCEQYLHVQFIQTCIGKKLLSFE